MSDGSDWCTIESDPGVFTCLIESFGVKNAELSELYSLDDDSLRTLPKVFGLIFLFKWTKDGHLNSAAPPLTGSDIPEGLFFAKQTVTNACATQAILSVLFNAAAENNNDDSSEDNTKDDKSGDGDSLSLGGVLSNFRSFTSTFPPDLRGEAIGASEDIRTAHNSFARRDAFITDDSKPRIASDDDDVFHFVAYVPHGDAVYELDGLKDGPVMVGKMAQSSDDSNGDGNAVEPWLSIARGAIQERIERYAASEIKFNLMAVVQDKRLGLNNQLQQMLSIQADEESEDIMTLRSQLATEDMKREQWKKENERRRHNYLPFCLELLKTIAKAGKMNDFTKDAQERITAKRQKK